MRHKGLYFVHVLTRSFQLPKSCTYKANVPKSNVVDAIENVLEYVIAHPVEFAHRHETTSRSAQTTRAVHCARHDAQRCCKSKSVLAWNGENGGHLSEIRVTVSKYANMRSFGSHHVPTDMVRHRRHVIAIEGNIGVGKSTVLKGLKAIFEQDPRVAFVDEDVDAWEKHGLLAGLYDGTLHKSAFQACALMPQVVKLHSALQNPSVELVITERSPWSNYHVFAKSNLDEVHLCAYEYLFHGTMELLAPYDLQVHVAFLDVPPTVAIERRIARGRESEESVLADYIRLLDERHRSVLMQLDALSGATLVDSTHIPSGSKEAVLETMNDLVSKVLFTTCSSPYSPTKATIESTTDLLSRTSPTHRRPDLHIEAQYSY